MEVELFPSSTIHQPPPHNSAGPPHTSKTRPKAKPIKTPINKSKSKQASIITYARKIPPAEESKTQKLSNPTPPGALPPRDPGREITQRLTVELKGPLLDSFEKA